jgi:hypothetical protein
MPALGLIQSRGLGDIVIALPIAKYYAEQGWSVYWPIDQRFYPSVRDSVSYVKFLPFEFRPTIAGFLTEPVKLLQARKCDRIVPLYSHLTGGAVANPGLARSLKFDEYKYAVAGVPFAEKWNLQIRRDPVREQDLARRVAPVSGPYAVQHLTGSDYRASYPMPAAYRGRSLVTVEAHTDNIFDWLGVLERAEFLALVDSCFANLVEQLGFGNAKAFLLRSEVRFTPVLRGAWRMIPRPN